MKGMNRYIAVVLCIAALPAAVNAGKSIGKDSGIVPAHVEEIAGSEVKKVVFTADAAQRAGVQVAEVEEKLVPPKRQAQGQVARKVVPYSALIYTPDGREWVYTVPENLTFVRQPIQVAYIKGDMIVLADGPDVGTRVVSVGVAEVYGSEFAVGH